MYLNNRRSFLKQMVLFSSGCLLSTRLPSSLLAAPSFDGPDSFIGPILDSLHYDRIAFVGLDLTGAHTAAHMTNDYLRVSGVRSQLHLNDVPGHLTPEFLKNAESKINSKAPDEKFILSYRIRMFAVKEFVEFVEKNKFKVFLFEPKSYSHAAMNWTVFLGSTKMPSMVHSDLRIGKIPDVKVNLAGLREEFDQEWEAYQVVKSNISNPTLLHFNETEYQDFIRTRLAGYPTWREPYLAQPETKILDPENLPSQPPIKLV